VLYLQTDRVSYDYELTSSCYVCNTTIFLSGRTWNRTTPHCVGWHQMAISSFFNGKVNRCKHLLAISFTSKNTRNSKNCCCYINCIYPKIVLGSEGVRHCSKCSVPQKLRAWQSIVGKFNTTTIYVLQLQSISHSLPPIWDQIHKYYYPPYHSNIITLSSLTELGFDNLSASSKCLFVDLINLWYLYWLFKIYSTSLP
jgi:hypothetical protein